MKLSNLLGSALVLSPLFWPLAALAAPPTASAPRAAKAAAAAQKPAPARSAPARSGARPTTPQPTTPRAPEKQPFAPSDAHAGALLFYGDDDDDNGWLAPQLTNHVELEVTGMVARARVAQSFENLSDEIVHAVYVFPLPETAAVDALTLQVGKRRIVGEIREREQAERSYERAVRQGRKASLVSQERPNLFTTKVANIAPHEVVTVELSYQQDVHYDAGVFSLEFPSTLTPRYTPGVGSDADAITPPLTLDGDGPTLELSATLNAGVALQRVTSPSHALTVSKSGNALGPVRVALRDDEVLADRDFRLEWAPAPSAAPTSAVFQEEFGGERYALLMLLPPDPSLDGAGRIPRETTFIIDTSGSMSGVSMEQARAALESGLGELLPSDRFNVIQFDDAATQLFERTVPATPDNVQRARGWVQGLQADGGTEMLSALGLAFGVPAAPEQLSQVVFITDGSVGNEADIFRFIQGNLKQRRLFTVGIGSAPNQYFMRSAARFGRGTFTSVSSTNEVTSRMNELWKKLNTPVMSQLEVAFPGDTQTETWPQRVPDLYRGEPLVVVAKLGAQAKSVRVSGRRAGQPFDAELALAGGSAAAPPHFERGIHRLWARRKIEELMDRMTLGQDEAELKPAVTALALQHHLLSKYTSLVAVDRVRSVEGEGNEVAVPNALPAGNDMFGNMPQTATPAPTCLLFGVMSLSAAWAAKRVRG